jgi:hypothetical protein
MSGCWSGWRGSTEQASIVAVLGQRQPGRTIAGNAAALVRPGFNEPIGYLQPALHATLIVSSGMR